MIKSIWSQKGALIGQFLSTAHRRLPLQDARTAAKTARKTLKSRLLGTSSRAPSPAPSAEHPLRVVTQPSTPSVASSTGLVRTGSHGSDSSDSNHSAAFPHVLDDSVPFSTEPDEVSLYPQSSTSANGHNPPERLSDDLIAGIEVRLEPSTYSCSTCANLDTSRARRLIPAIRAVSRLAIQLPLSSRSGFPFTIRSRNRGRARTKRSARCCWDPRRSDAAGDWK